MISRPIRFSVAAGTEVEADLSVPDDPIGLVVFAHGSGSSRLSPRNRSVADAPTERGLATLLMDLLTPVEAQKEIAVASFGSM
jgi:putative phosphoribosyl transferase